MNPRFPNAPRFAIVTGAAAGLGRAFCEQLAGDGWRIAIVDIDPAGAEETRRLIEQAGGTGQVELCDVTQPAAWQALGERLRADWRRLDLLINNAGIFASGHVGALDLADVDRVVQLNLLSVLYGCNTMAPWLIETATSSASAHRPHIINVASVFAHLCPPGMATYNMTKAGVIALSETLYGELRHRGVGVSVVCPGVMPTRFIEGAAFGTAAYRRLVETYVSRSSLQPAAVARAALAAMRHGKLYIIEGRRDRWYWRLKRLLPTTLLKAVARQTQKNLKSTTPPGHPGQ